MIPKPDSKGKSMDDFKSKQKKKALQYRSKKLDSQSQSDKKLLGRRPTKGFNNKRQGKLFQSVLEQGGRVKFGNRDNTQLMQHKLKRLKSRTPRKLGLNKPNGPTNGGVTGAPAPLSVPDRRKSGKTPFENKGRSSHPNGKIPFVNEGRPINIPKPADYSIPKSPTSNEGRPVAHPGGKTPFGGPKDGRGYLKPLKVPTRRKSS